MTLSPTQVSCIDTFNLQNDKTYKYKVRDFINPGAPCGKIYSASSNIDTATP